MPLAAIGLDCSHCFSNTLVTLYLTKHTIIVNWFYSCFMELVCLQEHTCYYCFQLNDFCNHFNQLCSCMLYCSYIVFITCMLCCQYAICFLYEDLYVNPSYGRYSYLDQTNKLVYWRRMYLKAPTNFKCLLIIRYTLQF